MNEINSYSIKKAKPIPIPIQKNMVEVDMFRNNYDLKLNFFDPAKSSPPNEFLIKLHNRLGNLKSHPVHNSFQKAN